LPLASSCSIASQSSIFTENPGAAFSLLADAPEFWRRLVLIGLSSILVAVVGWMVFRPHRKESAMAQAGLATVLGGGLGNLFDRIFVGTVTDFLQVFIGSYEFPSFNVADIAINVGAGILILDLLRNRHH
jgi:signal peptidase II